MYCSNCDKEIPDCVESCAFCGSQIPQDQEAQHPNTQIAPELEPPKKKRTGLIIGLVIGFVLLLAALGIGGYFIAKASIDSSGNKSANESKDEETVKTMAGRYAIVSVKANDKTYSNETLVTALEGMGRTTDDMAIELKDDGTFTMGQTGASYSGTFTISGNAISVKTHGGISYTGKINGNQIELTLFGMVFIYEKQ
jgi:hypothetical protein